MRIEASYERPVKAVLYVHLETGETFEATDLDLRMFNVVRSLDAYSQFEDALTGILTDAGLIDGDITKSHLNIVRYLAELAIRSPHLIKRDGDDWAAIAEIERALQNPNEALVYELRELRGSVASMTFTDAEKPMLFAVLEKIDRRIAVKERNTEKETT